MTCPKCNRPLVHCWRICSLLVSLLMCVTAFGQVVQVKTWHSSNPDRAYLGSAVCFGRDPESGEKVYATANHNFRDTDTAVVLLHGDSYPVTGIRKDPDRDLLLFWSAAPAAEKVLREAPLQSGESLHLVGWGPKHQGQTDRIATRHARMGADTEANTMTTGERLAEGQQIIKGDSGGLVEDQNGEFVGIITAHGTDDPSKTLFTPAAFVAALAQSCSGPQCRPIIIRRRVEQPMFGIGIPMGPPRSVDIAQPMPQPPQVYVPQPRPNPISTPPAQPQISADQIRQIVADYLQRNPPRDGLDGRNGDNGRDAEIDYNQVMAAIMPEIEKRIAAIPQKKATVHVIITDDGKVVFDRPGVPDGSTVRVPIKRVQR